MFIRILVTLFALVVVIVLIRRFFRRRRCRTRATKKIATDDAATVMNAHFSNPSDPLVLIHNRPDIAPLYRDEIISRLRDGIIAAQDMTDVEEIPRYVDAGRQLGVDLLPLAADVTRVVTRDVVRRDGVEAILDYKVAADPQNVHDPSVIRQMNKTLTSIATADTPISTIKQDILAEIDKMERKKEISSARANDARMALETMVEKNATCSSYGGRHEASILADTWEDAKKYSGDTRTGNIILGLADSMNGSSTVCVNGRIARIIGANSVQVSTGDLKAAAYSYAGKLYTDLGDAPTAEKIQDALGALDTYIAEMNDMPEDQRTIVREECRAVFADIETPSIEAPHHTSSTPPDPEPSTQSDPPAEGV